MVRLKGGDPLIFGRATEEIDACRAAGIPVEIVPGITAAQGAAAALGFSLTERKDARRGAVRHRPRRRRRAARRYRLDARRRSGRDHRRSTCRARRSPSSSRRRWPHGLDPATPAVAIASATRPDQAHVAGSLDEIAGLAEALAPGAPVIVIVGQVARTPAEAANLLSAAA